MTHAAAHGRGFTLIEIAMALIILGLIFGRGLSLLSSQMEQQRIRDTQRVLDEAREALLGYAANQTPPHLPCPDMTVAAATGTANDGLEDVTAATGHCVTQEGNLPWATLAVGGADAWGNRIRYSVNGIFSSRSPAASFSLSSVATLRVCSSASCASVLASGVPAVVLSHGANGFGAVTSSGVVRADPSSADEIDNTDGNGNFVSRSPTAAGSAMGEFDDIVSWLPTGSLFNRMLQAGRLP